MTILGVIYNIYGECIKYPIINKLIPQIAINFKILLIALLYLICNPHINKYMIIIENR